VVGWSQRSSSWRPSSLNLSRTEQNRWLEANARLLLGDHWVLVAPAAAGISVVSKILAVVLVLDLHVLLLLPTLVRIQLVRAPPPTSAAGHAGSYVGSTSSASSASRGVARLRLVRFGRANRLWWWPMAQTIVQCTSLRMPVARSIIVPLTVASAWSTTAHLCCCTSYARPLPVALAGCACEGPSVERAVAADVLTICVNVEELGAETERERTAGRRTMPLLDCRICGCARRQNLRV
jgi:hypothetical protein